MRALFAEMHGIASSIVEERKAARRKQREGKEEGEGEGGSGEGGRTITLIDLLLDACEEEEKEGQGVHLTDKEVRPTLDISPLWFALRSRTLVPLVPSLSLPRPLLLLFPLVLTRSSETMPSSSSSPGPRRPHGR